MIRVNKRRSSTDSNSAVLRNSASALLQRDFDVVIAAPEFKRDTISATCDYLTWNFTFRTEKESVYAGRWYAVTVNFSRRYPIDPPVVKLCRNNNTQFNPVPVEARCYGDLEIERFLYDTWRPMNGVQILMCVKELFAKKQKVFLARASLVSMLSQGAVGEALLLQLIDYVGIRSLSSMSTTCKDMFSLALSDRVWTRLYFSTVTIPPISLYAIKRFDLIRLKSSHGYWHWSGARDAYQRVRQVVGHLPSCHVHEIAMAEAHTLFALRHVATHPHWLWGRYLVDALQALDNAAWKCIVNRYQRSLRVALACFTREQFLGFLLEPPHTSLLSLSYFLSQYCGLGTQGTAWMRKLCRISSKHAHTYFSSQIGQLSSIDSPSLNDFLCILNDEHNTTCREFAALISTNVFDCRDKEGVWRIACKANGQWTDEEWQDSMASDPGQFVRRGDPADPIPEGLMDESFFAFRNEQGRHHLHPGLHVPPLDDIHHNMNINHMFLEAHVQASFVSHVSARRREASTRCASLAGNFHHFLPRKLSVHYLGCSNNFDEVRRGAGMPGEACVIAPFRTESGLAATVARDDVHRLLELRRGVVQLPPSDNSCSVVVRDISLSHVPGGGLVRYVVTPSTTVGELVKDFSGVFSCSPRHVGIILDMKKCIQQAVHLEMCEVGEMEGGSDPITAVNDLICRVGLGDELSLFVDLDPEKDLILDILPASVTSVKGVGGGQHWGI